MEPIINPFSGLPDVVQDLSGYVPYIGATADVDLGNYDLTADTLFAETLYLEDQQSSRLHTQWTNNDWVNASWVELEAKGGYGNLLAQSGTATLGKIKFEKERVWAIDSSTHDSKMSFSTIRDNLIIDSVSIDSRGTLDAIKMTSQVNEVSDWFQANATSGSYFYIEGGYAEVKGIGENCVMDFWNNGSGDAAFGLRPADDMFMIGTDYQLVSNLGLNMNMNHNWGLGRLPDDTYKFYIDGDTRMDGALINPSYVDFKLATTPAWAEGRLNWCPDHDTLRVGLSEENLWASVVENTFQVKNTSGATTPALTVVRPTGATGGNPTIGLADASDFDKISPVGLMRSASTLNNAIGNVTTFGRIAGVDTSAWAEGAILYLSATTPGALTTTIPAYPNYPVRLAVVTTSHATEGEVIVDGAIVHNINQDVSTTGTPTFAGLGLTGDLDMNGYDILDLDQLKYTDNHIAIGTGTATGQNPIAIGASSVSVDYGIAIGYSCVVANRSIAMGVLSDADAGYSIAIGYDADVDAAGSNSIAIGRNADVDGYDSVALGYNATCPSAKYSTALGAGATASGDYSTAVGRNANVTQTSSGAFGYAAQATGGYGCFAIGTSAKALGGSAFAMGYLAEAYGGAVAMGGQSYANSYSLAFGIYADASSVYAIAMGRDAIASGQYSIAIGAGSGGVNSANATGTWSVAIGYQAKATAHGAVALGYGTVNAADYSFKVGGGGVTDTFLDTELKVSGDIEGGSTKAFYFGDKTTDGSWRIVRNGDDLNFERRVSGSWVSKSVITG